MAELMRFDLVSPEGVLASQDAEAVDLPVSEGDMTAMLNHESLIATLKPGILRTRNADNFDEYVVTGGFVEVEPESTTVLAEQAFRRSELTANILNELTEKAQTLVDAAEGLQKDLAETRLACLKSLRIELDI